MENKRQIPDKSDGRLVCTHTQITQNGGSILFLNRLYFRLRFMYRMIAKMRSAATRTLTATRSGRLVFMVVGVDVEDSEVEDSDADVIVEVEL